MQTGARHACLPPSLQPPKHMPLHLKKKFKEKPPPTYFQVNPPSGVLMPGQFTDIQMKFTPSEEVSTLTLPHSY